jgi:hypothetical protein
MNKSILSFILLLAFLSFSTISYGQIGYGGNPLSLEIENVSELTDAPHYEFSPKVDWDKIFMEDELNDRNGKPMRVGVSVEVGLGINNSGNWTKLSNGDMMWRLHISTDGANGLGVVFDEFELPINGKLFVYNADYSQIIGAFTSKNNNEFGIFSTQIIRGSDIILEYIESNPSIRHDKKTTSLKVEQNNIEHIANAKLNISELAYIYVDGLMILGGDKANPGYSQNCHVDVNCTPVGDNWKNQKRGVLHLVTRSSEGWGLCSGSLINNTENDGTPYVLTADHCGGDASETHKLQWIFYFNYEREQCNTGAYPTEPFQTLTGCQTRARGPISGGSDFLLVELVDEIPMEYEPYLNGWDINHSTVEYSVGSPAAQIHHPAGDVKKISTSTNIANNTTSVNIGGSVMPANSTWRIRWTANDNGHGVTEGGSSGSPLFNNQGHIVGTLSGGSSSCSNPNSYDYNGKFSYHWTMNGSEPHQQLKYWLDPEDTGVTSYEGFDPFAPIYEVDGEIYKILAPENIQIADEAFAPAIIIRNNGEFNMTSATISYSIDGGAPVSEVWNGDLAFRDIDTLFFPEITISGLGISEIEATIAVANDENPENNSLTSEFIVHSSCNDAISIFPFVESFENSFPPNCWTLDNTLEKPHTWFQTPKITFTSISIVIKPQHGDQFLFIGWTDDTNQNEWLISPVFDFSNPDFEPYLNFHFAGQYAWSVHPNDNCDLDVLVRVDGGDWVEIWNEEESYELSGSLFEWISTDVFLDDYINEENVQFAFRYTGQDGSSFALDNFVIDNAPQRYELTVDIEGNGMVEVYGNEYTEPLQIVENRVVYLNATPDDGWEFDKWIIGENEYTETSIQVIIEESMTITAVFAEIPIYTLTVTRTPTGSGTTTPTPGYHDYPRGTSVQLTAIPNTGGGWEFEKWTIGSMNFISNPYNLTMYSNTTAVAHFKQATNITELNNAVKIFPNPSNGIYNLISENNYQLKISDISGKLILLQEIFIGPVFTFGTP